MSMYFYGRANNYSREVVNMGEQVIIFPFLISSLRLLCVSPRLCGF